MSEKAERLYFLKRQAADLQHWLDNWPAPRAHARKRKTRENLERVNDILRELAGWLIAGKTQP